MKIGIIVAMQKEMKLLLPLIGKIEKVNVEGYEYFRGEISNHQIAVMQCGIGKVNSALSTDALIRNFNPDLVINSGVAGGADSSMHVLDLFIADSVAYHDVWCGPDTKYGAAHGYDVILRPDKKIVDLAINSLNKDNLKIGLICSGDKFITTPAEINEIKSHFPNALAVDMESASIAQVCTRHSVPFNIVRVISDTPGESENISQYENFWTDAPNETFSALSFILGKL